jgi:hypothetical protein
MLRLLITALLCAIVATGCGGGGGAKQPPAPKPQSIAFADAGPVYKFFGDPSYSDVASGGGGSGGVSYASDTPSVANVDRQTGEVTILGPGVVQFTATKAADQVFLAAQANYTLRVAPRALAVTAWVGDSDTEVTFNPLPLALGFTRSSDLICDPTNFAICSNGTQTSIDSNPVVDPVATLSQPAMYWLNHGSNISQGVTVPEQKFGGSQVDPGVAVLNGRVWVVTDPPPHQVWSSADGANWRQETASTGFPPRTDFKLVAFNNALWVIGGVSSNMLLTDVWSSPDGKTWTQVTSAAGFPPRGWFAATAFNGRLWVSGGGSAGIDRNDVWSSPDGVNWTETTAAAASRPREQHQMVSFNGNLWLIGGFSSGAATADIWSSPDGVNWTEATSSAAFGPRFAHQVVSDGTKLWLTAGYDAYQSAQHDVWSSSDGANWVQVTGTAEFSPRADHGSVWWNGSVWVIGGGGSEVWSSSTGVHWSKQTLSARIPGATALATASYNGQLWALGDQLQLWSSVDGITWSEQTHVVPGSANDPLLLALSDRLLLIGGWQYSAPNSYRGVWQSTDGQTWTQLASTTGFSARDLNLVLQFNGQLWAFAGNVSNEMVPEIWSSPDGAVWTRVVADAPFGPRAASSVLVYNNALWVIGGINSAGIYLNDVWSSADGVTWNQVSPGTALPARTFGPALALSGGMCLYGTRETSVGAHDIWCSSDGSIWVQKSANAPLGPVTLLNGTGFMIGNTTDQIYSTDLVWKSVDGISWREGYQNSISFP